MEIGLIGQVAFDSALATALASVSSVLLTIGWGLVGSNALSRWSMLFLRVSCSLGHFSSTDLVLGLELDLLKSFSTSGWFSYPRVDDITYGNAMSFVARSNKVFKSNLSTTTKKLTFPESCKTGKADLSSFHVLVFQRRRVGAAMPAEENNSLSSQNNDKQDGWDKKRHF